MIVFVCVVVLDISDEGVLVTSLESVGESDAEGKRDADDVPRLEVFVNVADIISLESEGDGVTEMLDCGEYDTLRLFGNSLSDGVVERDAPS